MGDPLSIPAGVVGMVSLGIQLCQSLYTYCNNVQERTRDIKIVSDQIKSLESTFRSLATVVQRIISLPHASGTMISSLNHCVAACEGGLQELQEFVAPIDDIGGEGFKNKMQGVGKKMAFGFRRGELSTLQQKVHALTTTVGLAVQTLTLELGVDSFDTVAGVPEVIARRLSTLETGMLATIVTAQREAASEAVRASGTLELRMDSLEALLCDQYKQMSGLLSHSVDGNSGLVIPASRLLEKPGALREACDIVRQTSLQASGSRDIRRRNLLSTYCDCDLAERTRISTEKKVRLGTVVLLNERHEVSKHFKNCPLYVRTRARRRVSAQFRTGMWPGLPMLVRASMACTSGAGGLSISPQLSFCVAVKDSCAQHIIQQMIGIASTPPDFITPDGGPATDDWVLEMMRRAMNRLHVVFDTGAGSPTERMPDGSSLLHYVVQQCRKRWPMAKGIRQDRIISLIIELIKTLVLAGAPVDEVDMDQATPLDKLMDSRWPKSCMYSPDEVLPRLRLAEAVASLADNIPLINVDYGSPFNVLQFVMESSVLIEDLGLPPLPAAILNRSESQVRSVLAKYPNSATETMYGMITLHLSSHWPAGLEILLSTDARKLVDKLCIPEASAQADLPCETTGHRATPLDFALRFRCEGAVRILLDAGATWNNFHLEDPSSVGCSRIVAGYLAARRQRLFDLATEAMSTEDLYSVCPDLMAVDSYASAIVKRLQSIGVTVPSDLTVEDGYEGVYISGCLDIIHFPIFFDAGFRDVTHHGRAGLTAIQLAQLGLCGFRCEDGNMSLSLESLDWLERRGCLDQQLPDPLSQGVNTSATGWHILALRLNFLGPSRQSNKILKRVFESRRSDSCDCPCSNMGCLALTTYLKAMSYSQSRQCGLRGFSLGRESQTWSFIPDGIEMELLRFITFEALDMAHTCCTGALGGAPCPRHVAVGIIRFHGDSDEIRQEEEELAQRLEALLAEFETQFRESKVELRDFVWGYWMDRMRSECVPADGESVENSTSLDVVFEKEYETPFRLRRLLKSNLDRGNGSSSCGGYVGCSHE